MICSRRRVTTRGAEPSADCTWIETGVCASPWIKPTTSPIDLSRELTQVPLASETAKSRSPGRSCPLALAGLPRTKDLLVAYNADYLTTAVKRLMLEAGIENRSLHSLRHFFAQDALRRHRLRG